MTKVEKEHINTVKRHESGLNAQIRAAEAQMTEMKGKHARDEAHLRSRLEERRKKKRNSIQYYDTELNKLRRELDDCVQSNKTKENSQRAVVNTLKKQIEEVNDTKAGLLESNDGELDTTGAELIVETEQFAREKESLAEQREQISLEQESMDQEKRQLEEQAKLIMFEKRSLEETQIKVGNTALNADVSRANPNEVIRIRDQLADEVQSIDREWQNVDKAKRQMQDLHREFAQELQTEIHVLENAR